MKPNRHVLMISLEGKILSDPLGDSVERHREYASRIGKISMVVYSSKKGYLPKSFDNKLFLYPTNSLSKFHFLFDAYKIARKIVRKDMVDLITTQDPFGTGLVGVVLKKKFNIPIEIQNHSTFIDNFDWINEKPIFFRFLNFLAKRFVLPYGDRFRVLNTREFDIYKQCGISENLIQIIPTPVNVDRFLDFKISDMNKMQIKEKYKIDGNCRILIWVGRPVKFKRIQFLIDVFLKVKEENKNVVLMLVGDLNLMSNRDRSYLELNRIKGIITPGQINHEDLPALYAISDVYVHTSIYEGFGKIIIEAMASGLPVVVSQTQGPSDFIKNGENGFIVNDRKPEIFGNVINQILKNRNLKMRIGNEARDFASTHFNRGMLIDKIVNHWRNMN